MEAVVLALVIIAAVASRPIEMRLWRAGRLSDRTTAVLLLGRFPALCFVFGLMANAPTDLLVGTTAISMVPPVLFYRFTLDLLRRQHRA
jgi:hypothetical protein